jgi:hypothetical protein
MNEILNEESSSIGEICVIIQEMVNSDSSVKNYYINKRE